MKEVIFVLLNEFADWEGAFIAACLNQGVMPGSPVPYKVKTLSTVSYTHLVVFASSL